MKHMNKYVLTTSIALAATLGNPAIATDNKGANIEQVLDELTRQHNGASSLVKSARQPVSPTFNSPLLTQPSKSQTKDEPVLEKLTAAASNTMNKFKQTGIASWYGRQFHGRKTASGETFNMNALTAAHRSLPLNCYIKVTNKDNGKSVVVKVNDRGPFQGDRVLDLSYGAAKVIGLTQRSTGNVIIERVDGPE
ncbi:septal ring lytic transglycosylase RlpA family protein [Moraxella haemolytica]|uniref:septal ring lytic transglycosylase RlpA family protein n=1 Tax=Moraxella haemolytica TaxID=2904119 RepID=UPI0025431DB6|nr:septal ring lytic transglycosylase RlpA family protein [Moraxella sp. ZY171148]WII96228.1 septal ring lytic transglycosylase RlpA family protein [Moraxella sp. ZY171148]